jgi:molybdate transport system substrate-binding protein
LRTNSELFSLFQFQIHDEGLSLVGTLPAEFGVDIVMSAGVVAGSKQPEAAAVFVKFLTSSQAASTIRARGMQPG